MKIIETTDAGLPKLSAALGFFDGVHLGHKRIITAAVENAKNAGLCSAVVTLSGHPANILAGSPIVPILTGNEEKARIIEELRADYLIIIPFTKAFAGLSPSDFVSKILVDKLNISAAFCGSNYSFGKEGQGHSDDLSRLGKRYGMSVTVIPPIKKSDCIISSSYIRSYISAGKVATANQLLGRPFSLTSPVVHGNQIGSTRLYPTINQYLSEYSAVLKYGVYATTAVIDGVPYRSVTNVGIRPTIGSELPENAETFILDFDGELYGKSIRVEYITRLRDEVRFYSIEDLKKQITEDIEARRSLPLSAEI